MTTMELVYIAAIAALLVDSSTAINCTSNRCTEQGKQHILCKYPDPNPSPNCGEVFSWGVTPEDIVEIVSTHNQIRMNVSIGLMLDGNPGPQPPASDMQPLSWDEELATMAQRWTNLCRPPTDECADVDRFAVNKIGGYATLHSPESTYRPYDMVQFFSTDVRHVNRADVYRYPADSNSELYTQVVWAKTSKVGCGIIKYKTNDGIITYLMRCLYGPGGNVVGEPVYTTWAV